MKKVLIKKLICLVMILGIISDSLIVKSITSQNVNLYTNNKGDIKNDIIINSNTDENNNIINKEIDKNSNIISTEINENGIITYNKIDHNNIISKEIDKDTISINNEDDIGININENDIDFNNNENIYNMLQGVNVNDIINYSIPYLNNIAFSNLSLETYSGYEESYEYVKNNLNSILTKLINSDVNIKSSIGLEKNDKYYKDIIELNSLEIMKGLVYLHRLYNFNSPKGNVFELILSSSNSFGKEYENFDAIINIGSSSYTYMGLSGYSLRITDIGYEKIIKSAITSNYTLETFFKSIYGSDISSNFKTYLPYKVAERNQNNSASHSSIYDKLISSDKGKRFILLLLNMPKDSMYIITNGRTIAMGQSDTYIKNRSGSELEEFYNKVDSVADNMRDYIDFWNRISIDNSLLNVNDSYLFDTLSILDKGTNTSTSWSSQLGDGTSDFVKYFLKPTKNYRSFIYSNAEASGIDIQCFLVKALSDEGLSAYTHETAHHLHKTTFTNNYGMKDDSTPELYCRGIFESYEKDEPYFNINQIYSRGEIYSISSPNDINNISDLNNYYSNMLDVIHTLDLLEGEAILKRSDGEKLKLINILEQVEDTSTIYKNHTKANFRYSSENDISKIKTIDDLVDNNTVVYRFEAKGLAVVGTLDNNQYERAPLFSSMYAAPTNNYGQSSDITSKRYAFELLGEYGYYEGLVPFISNQYKNELISLSDSKIINKISNGKFNTFSDFKKYSLNKAKIDSKDLINITINGNSITSYDELLDLMSEAITKDLSESMTKYPDSIAKDCYTKRASKTYVEQLKDKIFKAYRNETNEFKNSIYTSIETHTHKEEVTKGYASTCTKAGLSDGKKCSECGEILVKQTEIKIASHKEVVIKGYASTCTKAGLSDGKKCSECGEILVEQTEIKKASHKEVVIKGYASTTEKSGLSDGKKCSVCKSVLVAQSIIPKLEEKVPVYRLYNIIPGKYARHIMTSSREEGENLVKNHGWNWDNEGDPIFYNINNGKTEYRLYKVNNLDNKAKHVFISDEKEMNNAIKGGWILDGKETYMTSSNTNSGTAIYRLWNSSRGRHLYTSSKEEYNNLNGINGWKGEGIKMYMETTVDAHSHEYKNGKCTYSGCKKTK